MRLFNYTIRFHTPAFLGNAEQSGQWRTPPFKAQLRQWWRAVYAAEKKFAVDVAKMRHEEGLLFGNAWLEDEFCKSRIRLRLDHWNTGKLTAWQPCDRVKHPEVPQSIGSDLYLGFGPIIGADLRANAAIQYGEFATLSLAVPDPYAPRIERALGLMDRYGTVGGRSRNGWGSFHLMPQDQTPALNNEPIVRPWQEALALDWPHAIGKDGQPLIWQTALHADWKALMKTLAIVKIGLRTQFIFPNEQPDGEIHDRHWLSYPVTRHKVAVWDKQNLRLPNSLRFKVRPTAEGKLVGVIFHVPCKPPAAFGHDPQTLEAVWKHVHAFLDAPAQSLTRIPE